MLKNETTFSVSAAPEGVSFSYSRDDYMLEDKFEVSVISRKVFSTLGIAVTGFEVSGEEFC